MSRLRFAFFFVFAVCAVSGVAAEVQTDVCVYGATSGGVMAAVQAARMGKSVALISTNTHVGGMTTGGLSSADVGVSASIGGLALEFFTQLGVHYGVNGPKFVYEPHVAEQEMDAMLTAAGVNVYGNEQLASVTMNGQSITQITMEDGTVYSAKMFIDTSYEGDLMSKAGVTWTIGRESSATYGESLNGVTAGFYGDIGAPNLDPYVVPGLASSGLLPLLQPGSDPTTVGVADAEVQSYNYRLCLTTTAANQIPIVAPTGYKESRYELLGRVVDARVAAGGPLSLANFVAIYALPGTKFDFNNNGYVSTDYVGNSEGYAAATYANREANAVYHLGYIQGYLYYLGHSLRVPSSVRAQMLTYGVCRDEFTDSGGYPLQLYIREARRMVSDYVMLQQNCAGTQVADDSIGLASMGMDSHCTRRIPRNGAVWSDGGLNVAVPQPFPVSYRSIVPSVGECVNLLVPWALSASHVAFCSIRTEPVFMILSQSAATAAVLAIDDGVAVQDVNYNDLAQQLLAYNQMLTWNAAAPGAIVVTDSDATGVSIAGTWYASTVTPGYVGANYLQDGNTGKGQKAVRFTPTIPVTGSYNVYLRWTSNTNRATNVPVDVTSASGTTTYTVNQQANGGVWVKLNTAGPLTLQAGTASSVRVRNTGTNGYVVANAAEFIYIPPPAP